jgi:hypothetical protein
MLKRKNTNMIRIPPLSSSTSMAQTNNQELQENQSKDMDEGLALAMETMGRERERKRKKMREEGGLPLCQDPLDLLGRDLMLRVLNNLDARSVARCLVVSRSWNCVASSDLLWTSKVFFFCLSFLIDVCSDTVMGLIIIYLIGEF